MTTDISRGQGRDGCSEESLAAELDTPPETQETGGARLSLVEHLEELRSRLFFCLAAVGIGTTVAFLFYEPILQFLSALFPVRLTPSPPTTGSPRLRSPASARASPSS